MQNPNKELLHLIACFELTQMKVAELCQCSRTTVHYWTRPAIDPTFQPIKPCYLELLQFKLGVHADQAA